MSVSLWAYDPEICEGNFCVGDCDLCPKSDREGVYDGDETNVLAQDR